MSAFRMHVFVLLAAASLLMAFAAAEHSYADCPANITAIGAGDTMLYLIDDPEYGTYLYEETNGHPWVQRGGEAWWEVGTPYSPDCWDVDTETGEKIENPDFIVV